MGEVEDRVWHLTKLAGEWAAKDPEHARTYRRLQLEAVHGTGSLGEMAHASRRVPLPPRQSEFSVSEAEAAGRLGGCQCYCRCFVG